MKFKDIEKAITFSSQLVDKVETKLKWNFLKHNFPKWKTIAEKFNDKLEEKKLDLALTGDRGEVLHDEKNNYKFTKEAIKDLNAFSKVQRDQDYEFEFRMTKFEDLSKEELVKLCELNQDGTFKKYLPGYTQEDVKIFSLFIDNLPAYKEELEFEEKN